MKTLRLTAFAGFISSTFMLSPAAAGDAGRERNLAETVDIVWILIAAILAFGMQGGFMCLESGMARAKNTINVAIKNLMDVIIAVGVFWLFGFGLMFGDSYLGVIGSSQFFPQFEATPWLAAFFVFQAVFCGTAATIDSGAIAERTKFSAYLLISTMTSAMIYPVFGHWAWGGLLHEGQAGWLEALGFVDFAGSTVVHSVGGWVALAAVIVIGPRIGRFDENGNPQTILPHSLTLTCLGTFLLFLGWFGFNCGSTLKATPQIAEIAMHTLISASAGGWVGAGLSAMFHPDRLPKIEDITNGTLGGLVAITAGCASVPAYGAVCIGLLGGTAVYFSRLAMEHVFQLDDVVGSVPVHGVAGAVGTIFTAVFMSHEALLANGLTRWQQLGVQCLGAGTAFVWAFGIAFIALKLMNRWISLRVCKEHERMGLNVSEHGAPSTLLELANSMHQVAEDGCYEAATRVPVERGTEVGDLAKSFNRMIDAVAEHQSRMTAIVENAGEGILALNEIGEIESVNAAAEGMFQYVESELRGVPFPRIVKDAADTEAASQEPDPAAFVEQFLGKGHEVTGIRKDETSFPLELAVSRIENNPTTLYTVVAHDLSNRKRLETQLAHARKMEAVGQLAAGIAHEINTPIQYVSENAKFLRDSFSSLEEFFEATLTLVDAFGDEPLEPALVDRIKKAVHEADLDYLRDEMPTAIEQSLEGTQRVATIVQSMKEFSHPGTKQKSVVDLNHAIQSTITVARGEWKRVADLETDFDNELPPVPCLPGELNQSILNLIVNAAHAIESARQQDETSPGRITVRTRQVDPWAEIRISDTGTGISKKEQGKIFDPFYTTKPIGKGTGQGLAITHAVVVEKHGGTISVESEVGRGTTFTIRIPLEDKSMRVVAAGPVDELANAKTM